jgi:putative hydrolase of HD superfamily
VLKLAAVHDLCELDHGDTFIHTADRNAQRRLEEKCIARLMTDHGDVFRELEALWEEYEAGETSESKFVYAADRLLPFLHNLANEGRSWREHDISRSQVLSLYERLRPDFPGLVDWVERKIGEAVESGWLRDE